MLLGSELVLESYNSRASGSAQIVLPSGVQNPKPSRIVPSFLILARTTARAVALLRSQFGFYHDKRRHAVRVRNVVLSGDWPKTLGPAVLDNLLEPVRPRTVDERRVMAHVIDEKFHGMGIDQEDRGSVVLTSLSIRAERLDGAP